jgi:hypothetical protein
MAKPLYAQILRRRPLGAFGEPCYERVYRDAGEHRGGKQAFIAIHLPFVFTRPVVNPDVRITMTGRRRWHNSLNPLLFSYPWRFDVQQKTWRPGDGFQIPLAFIAQNPDNHAYTGDFTEPPQVIAHEHLFQVDIFGDDHARQQFKVYLKIPHRRRDVAMEPGPFPGDLFFLLTERDRPLQDGRFDPQDQRNQVAPRDVPALGWGTRPHSSL